MTPTVVKLLLGAGLAVWGGFWWRARGGGLAQLTGSRLGGTTTTRLLCGLPMIAPLCFITWHAIALWPAEYLAWAISGWGPFQDMGQDGNRENPSWAGWLVARAGIRSPLWHDFGGMVLIGLTCMALPALAIAWMLWPEPGRAPLVWLAGLGLAPLYLAGDRLRFPPLGRFCRGQEWREVLTGAWVLLWLTWGVPGALA